MYDKLTPNDIKKIEAEISERKNVIGVQINEEIKEARAQGDLSENFEYYAARRAKGKNDSRIRYLESILRTAEVIDEPVEEGVVGVNNLVEVFLENRNVKRIFKVVTTIRADSLKGYVSIESPIGKAILGHKEGDRVQVVVNEHVSYYAKILSIDNSVDDEDDEINKY